MYVLAGIRVWVFLLIKRRNPVKETAKKKKAGQLAVFSVQLFNFIIYYHVTYTSTFYNFLGIRAPPTPRA
jgi:hypothetical protein